MIFVHTINVFYFIVDFDHFSRVRKYFFYFFFFLTNLIKNCVHNQARSISKLKQNNENFSI